MNDLNVSTIGTEVEAALPVLPLKNTVIYPEQTSVLAVGRASSLAAIKAASDGDQLLIAVAQRDPQEQSPGPGDLHDVACLVRVQRVEEGEDGVRVVVQGIQRIRLLQAVDSTATYLRMRYTKLPVVTLEAAGADTTRAEALARDNLSLARKLAVAYDVVNGEQIVQQLVGVITDPIIQTYRLASLARLDIERLQHILQADTALALIEKLHATLQHEIHVIEVQKEIAEQTQEGITKQQREHVLRQQKRAIDQALGEASEEDDDIVELRKQLDEADLPENVRKEVDRELKRLNRLSANAGDYQVIRGYLELVAELPWHKVSDDKLELSHAEAVLNEDHYGLEDIKDRILENLAVMQLNPAARAPILCFVGPPGVGKTSLGQSIARATGREFERLSLGGLHDESELRGHRRTYVGAMPGRIIQSIRRAGVKNPLLMLDEIDKLGRDFRGDPAAALMEILDPAQNNTFLDNFLNLPFDLSRVFFITTANSLEGIPRPLLDRMEIVMLSGYSDDEKQEIARRYLIPRQLKESGLNSEQLDFSDTALATLIRRFTREAGVRELERVIGQVARKQARRILQADSPDTATPIDAAQLIALLGPEKFKSERLRKDLPSGVAAGLAWTEAGGDILYVEATRAQRDEKITLTGQLGNVMQESARAARSYIWANAEAFGLEKQAIEEYGVHIHVPAGAVPKDGPSAGVTLATALVSTYSNQPVRSDVAMTGELTLTGLVLPVGGIKEKVLAAHRNGIRHIILPADNEADLSKLPEAVRSDLQFTLAETLRDVITVAIPQLA